MWHQVEYEKDIDPESGLSWKLRSFCDHYMSHLSRTKALRDAGYQADNIDNARKYASFLLKKHDVQAWIALKTQERADRLGITADKTLLELAIVAFSSVGDYVLDDEGRISVRPGVPIEALRAVTSVKVRRRVITRGRGDKAATEVLWEGEFKLLDKMKALELLCRHLGLISADLPPLEVLLNRLPPHVAAILRQLLASPGRRPELSNADHHNAPLDGA